MGIRVRPGMRPMGRQFRREVKEIEVKVSMIITAASVITIKKMGEILSLG